MSSARLVAAFFLGGVVMPAGLLAQTTSHHSNGVTAFVDVGVVPMDRERLLEHQTVVVRGNRIVALGPAGKVKVPSGAVQVGGKGKFLIPGLADMHSHLPGFNRLVRLTWTGREDRAELDDHVFKDLDRVDAENMLLLYAAAGVTTIRVMHGWQDMLDLRAHAADGAIISPRLYVATVQGLAEAFAQRSDTMLPILAKRAGYDLIKMNGLNGPALDTLSAIAHRVGIPIAGHAPGLTTSDSTEPVRRAIEAGYASIEHLTGFVDNYGRGAVFFDSTRLRELAKRMRDADVYMCPTMMTLGLNVGYFNYDSIIRRPELRFFADSVRQELTPPDGPPPAMDSIVRVMQVRYHILKVLQDEGVGLLVGTDAEVGKLVPGYATHREMAEFVKAGLTPYQALAAATRNVAAYFRNLDSAGTVEVGKRADLVLLTANPLVDIRNTTHTAGVMVAGRWLPPDEMEQRLKVIEGKLR